MKKRDRSKPHTSEEQLAAEKARLEAKLAKALRGPDRDVLMKKIRLIDTAPHLNEWLSSPGLQPPRR